MAGRCHRASDHRSSSADRAKCARPLVGLAAAVGRQAGMAALAATRPTQHKCVQMSPEMAMHEVYSGRSRVPCRLYLMRLWHLSLSLSLSLPPTVMRCWTHATAVFEAGLGVLTHTERATKRRLAAARSGRCGKSSPKAQRVGWLLVGVQRPAKPGANGPGFSAAGGKYKVHMRGGGDVKTMQVERMM